MSNVVYVDFEKRGVAAVEAAIVDTDPPTASANVGGAMPHGGSAVSASHRSDLTSLNGRLLHRASEAASSLNGMQEEARALGETSNRIQHETNSLKAAIEQLSEAIQRLEDLPRQARALVEAAI